MAMYWAAITLGPIVLGASLMLTSYAVSASKGWVSDMPGAVSVVLYSLQIVLLSSSMAVMFRYIPNTFVRWGHAWIGGLLVACGIELAKKALTLYLSKVPTYSLVYGAFATVPILLVWIYVAWVIVLLGATLTAYLPGLLAGASHRKMGVGWQFQLALEVLSQLAVVRSQEGKGLSSSQLSTILHVDNARLQTVLQALQALDWLGLLQENKADETESRYVMLVDPKTVVVQPLVERLLLADHAATEKIWQNALWKTMTLQFALPDGANP
jgi:membrane protein